MRHTGTKAAVRAGAVAALIPAVFAAGCGGGGGGQGTKVATNATQYRFDARNFGNRPRGANLWYPLKPGRQLVKLGAVNIGHRRLVHRRVTTVTGVSKTIDGVRAIAILDQDFNGGEIAEQAIDYVAEDRAGNIWYFGSYTESYEGGRFVNAADAWLAGLQGATPGVLMPATPRANTPPFSTQQGGNHAPIAEVLRTGQSRCSPFKCYKNVVLIQEGAPDEREHKYYAPDVGLIRTEPRSTGGKQETEDLVNLTKLSPRALADLSAETVRLDRHARTQASRVFGVGPPARRGI
jgi:hypothetical protein